MTRIYIEDTIVSPATALGQAGVGIVRVSGKKCLEIGLALCQKKGLVNRCAHFAKFFDLHNELIDFGIVIYFQSPASFTGEDVLEIHCHGSPVIIDLIVQRCLQLGARAARAGEFTERAFFNEKIDLKNLLNSYKKMSLISNQQITWISHSMFFSQGSLIDNNFFHRNLFSLSPH